MLIHGGFRVETNKYMCYSARAGKSCYLLQDPKSTDGCKEPRIDSWFFAMYLTNSIYQITIDPMESETKFWLITDTHFNHTDKMVEYCGRPLDYEDRIWRSLERIPEKDVLIHLGDITIGKDKSVHERIQKLPYRKWLVRGNHDHKSDTWYLNNGWSFVCESFDVVFRHRKITFSHKPVVDNGFVYNIHGHFHNSDFRRNEQELVALYTEKHKLLALEHEGYSPISLSSFVDKIIQREYARK